MITIRDISPEARWKIAARSASAMPILFDQMFKEPFGELYDNLMLHFWTESGKEVRSIARALHLPLESAEEVNNALCIVSTILMGPEFEGQAVEASPDRVVQRVTKCPMYNRAREMGHLRSCQPFYCETFCRSAVESMNPRYSHRHASKMCADDPYCERIVERTRR
ncbi:MAG: hypothetical protein GKC10_01415 [Methanosarcinales archaeon]|nr:hypothetical protein [Methanosarcinales archaeon]